MTLKDLITQIKPVEDLAESLYHQASQKFSEDIPFQQFLKELADDERLHFEILDNIPPRLQNKIMEPSFIILDKKTTGPTIKLLKRLIKKLSSNSLSKEELLDRILEIELKEWNDIFLYAIHALKPNPKDFKDTARLVQNHIRRVEFFFESLPGGIGKIKDIKKLDPIWTENILIVDDNQIINELLKAILNREGNIDIALNGREAMEKLREKFYKLIIADVEMPVMNGIEFFQEAQKEFPDIAARFLFHTGTSDQTYLDFIKSNNVIWPKIPIGRKVSIIALGFEIFYNKNIQPPGF